ncbi:MAG: hypothetical protein NFCOHLIN_01378 [Gammaproteobacteria bacterium]|nr:hypothetical protein [Gammaproteobacteria bacterium]
MPWLLALVGGLLGAAWFEGAGLVLGLLGGLLLGGYLRLADRVRRLERKVAALTSGAAMAAADTETAPVTAGVAPAVAAGPAEPSGGLTPPAVSGQAQAAARERAPPAAAAHTAAAGTPSQPHAVPATRPPDRLDRLLIRLREYFTTGNVVAKIGAIVLFFGVAFLLKYAVERNAVPVELRLAAVAAGGLALLITGWRKRSARAAIGLILQGAGVGVLYLTMFAAARLYDALPHPAAFGLMLAVVALSGMLAVLQNAPALAVAGSIGGFLAPVLLSRGGGSHVALFSYYALLNAGIFGIAWFRSWRILNWTGFIFTFLIATLWGAIHYRSEHFATTEPFLLLFFLFYLATSILFAYRQPPRLKGYIDASLVFGLPVIAFVLQCVLVEDYEYGRAISALVLGGLYLGLAWTLWGRLGAEMRPLAEAFLALGIAFLTLTIPFALDARLTAAAWALEGAGMVWVGFRQHRVLPRTFGLLLQLLAGCAFAVKSTNLAGATPVFNSAYLGGVFVALAALFSAYWYERRYEDLRPGERGLHGLLLIWGLVWWFAAGGQEIQRQVSAEYRLHAMVLCSALSFHAAGLLAARWHWRSLAQASMLNMLATVVLLALAYLLDHHAQPFRNLGWIAWPLAFHAWYDLLWGYQRAWPRGVLRYGHAAAVWSAVFLGAWALARGLTAWVGDGNTWPLIAWGLVPAFAIAATLRWGERLRWPIRAHPGVYLGGAPAGLAAFLLCWLLASCFEAGSPAPLRYLPVVNPLELTQGLALVSIVLWALQAKRHDIPVIRGWEPSWIPALLGVSVFMLANAVVARAVHHLAGVPYTLPALVGSALFEAAIAILWGVTALAVMSHASRRGVRRLWFAGAGLLGVLIVKLFLVDLSGTGTVGRIVSFLATGGLMLLIGYVSPMPPRSEAVRS